MQLENKSKGSWGSVLCYVLWYHLCLYVPWSLLELLTCLTLFDVPLWFVIENLCSLQSWSGAQSSCKSLVMASVCLRGLLAHPSLIHPAPAEEQPGVGCVWWSTRVSVGQSDFSVKKILVMWIFCSSPPAVFFTVHQTWKYVKKKSIFTKWWTNESKYKIVYVLNSSGINFSCKIIACVGSCLMLSVYMWTLS